MPTKTKKPATKKAAAPKATKTAKAPAKKAAPKKAASAKAKSDQRTGDAPRSQLDLEETKKLEAARTKKAKASANGEPKTKKVSAIDAAAQVLADSQTPMNAKQMIETLAAKNLWTSPGGKTPHATLYSAILREIATKGAEARFKKTDRGHFTANG